MGKPTGFLEYSRALPILAIPTERIAGWSEFHGHLPDEELAKQGGRCMNCGIPFCHTGTMAAGVAVGCPLHNLIPEWNDLVYRGRWREAYERLALTNNFPEFTGRVCPAPCESSCVLGISEEPVMIKEIELSIIDRAFDEGWVGDRGSTSRTAKRVAIVGSGPAGLACADELNSRGHSVTVFERDDRVGGLLMYGIPNMKLDKSLVQRRVDLMAESGIEFRTGIEVGKDVSPDELKSEYDAVVLCSGAPKPRDLNVEGRELAGVHFAMEYLTGSTKAFLAGESSSIDARDRNVIVIGGGDTGTDCAATAIRQGCSSLVQFEIMPRAFDRERTHDGWLKIGRTFQVDYGQEEAGEVFGRDPREYSIMTKRFVGEQGQLRSIETVHVEGSFREIEGTERTWAADLVFLAMGFTGGEGPILFEQFGVSTNANYIVEVDAEKRTNVPGIFSAGDCERGQSLVVWAIADGRRAAASVHEYLKAEAIAETARL